MKFILKIFRALAALAGLGGLAWLAFYLFTNGANGRLRSGGRLRRYLLHVPPGLQPGRPVPLVLSLHGFFDWPTHQASMTRWNLLADREGFIVVYPMGLCFPRRWNAHHPQTGPDDTTFIRQLIDHLEQEHTIDPARIYVNGFSNGGGMCVVLACQLAQRVAAVGCVSGAYLYPGALSTPAQPVPLIAFHGTADPIVPFHGGPSRSNDGMLFPDVPGWMQAWARRNGCAGAPQPLPAQGAVSGVRYSGERAASQVEFYTITGGGHTWPGGVPMPYIITGLTTQDVDATGLMWQFFLRHTLDERGEAVGS